MKIVILIMFVLSGCGQMDYQTTNRVVCGDEPGPCVDADAGEADAGTDAGEGD